MRSLGGLVLLLPLLFLPGTSEAVVVDRIALVVNDEVVTISEMERLVRIEKDGGFVSATEYVRRERLREAVEPFIEDLLLRQEARKMKIEVQDREVERVIEGMRKENLIPREELEHHLRKQGIAYADFFEAIRTSILRTKVLSQIISVSMSLSDDVLRGYYEAHKEEFREEDLHLKQMFFSHTEEGARDLADKALEELRGGAEFDRVATKFSGNAGADLGFVRVSELVPEIREALRSISEGMFTGVVVGPYGFHIIKLEEIRKGDVLPFESVKEEVRQRLIKAEWERRYKEYMERLKKDSYIEVKI
jgi:peptidyl-prolyl cis-trans isomerase SurA